MSTRIPPSLKWLINKRARLAGRINKIQDSIGKLEEAEKTLIKLREHREALQKIRLSLQEDLAGLDRVFGLHDIQIDVEYIQTIAPRKKRIDLPYGELTNCLLTFLRLNKGEPLSTDALTIMLAKRFPHLEGATEDDFRRLRNIVRKRLKNMAADDLVARAPHAFKGKSPRWILPTAIHHS